MYVVLHVTIYTDHFILKKKTNQTYHYYTYHILIIHITKTTTLPIIKTFEAVFH